jgi:hypothetical protein
MTLALVGTAAAGVIAYALLRHGFPDRAGRVVLTVLALVVVAAPPLVLGAFWFVLGEVLELPTRVRRMPLEARQHGEELRRLVEQARGRRGARAVPGQIWRLARLTTSSRELLSPYAPLLPLLNLPFLAAVVLSAAAVFPEATAAVIVAIVLAVG